MAAIKPQKLKIFLARHGQDTDNVNCILNGHRDTRLTPKGIEQATMLAHKIMDARITLDKIYTSPLQRTLQTAQIIAKINEYESPNILPDLIERDFGIMTGQPTDKIMEMCAPNILQTGKVTYFLNPTGSETFPDLIQRANRLLDFIYSMHTEGSILLVTHGDIGKMIYAAYYNKVEEKEWKETLKSFYFANTDLILLENTKETPESAVKI